MNDRIAFAVAAVVVAALVLDGAINGAAATLFLIRKLADLIYFLSFWRH